MCSFRLIFYINIDCAVAKRKKRKKYGTDSIKVLDKIGYTDYNKNMESIPQ